MLNFTSAGLPTPTTINLPSSKPTRMWLYSLVTETQWIGNRMVNGVTLRFKLEEIKTRHSYMHIGWMHRLYTGGNFIIQLCIPTLQMSDLQAHTAISPTIVQFLIISLSSSPLEILLTLQQDSSDHADPSNCQSSAYIASFCCCCLRQGLAMQARLTWNTQSS